MERFSERQRYVLTLLAVFAAYTATAKIGLSIDPVNNFATLIWPPTGIALAALILGGYRLWPAIFMGAFVANLWTGAPLPVAGGIAVGNSLEALAGTFLLRRFTGIEFSFGHLRESLVYIASAAITGPVVGATIGVTSLLMGGLLSAQGVSETWLAWWTGDALGALTIGPFLLRWFSKPFYIRTNWQHMEMAVVILTVSATAFFVFCTGFSEFQYPLFVPLVWAALRTGPRGVTLSIVLLSVIALIGTLTGAGPYAEFPPELRLFYLQLFIGTAAVIFLIFVSIVEDRRRSTQELKKQVDQLGKAMEKIQLEDQAKTEFLAILAHELRNPLAPILSSLELMRMREIGRAETLRLIATIEKHARSMSKLLDDLLEVSRISRKKFKLKKKTVDVRESIQRAIETVEPLLHARSHKLELVQPEEALYLLADPLRLEQILVNLLNNAAKYTRPGGRINLSCHAENSDVVITVRDSGMGIEKNMLERIFEPFVQINKTATVLGGVGIGLSLTKRLVEMHGGTIDVSSEGEDKGSEFRIRLPGVAAAEQQKEVVERKPQRPRKSLRVLVVDDNIDAANALGKLLEARGYTVMLAHDGASTIQIAETLKPDVVVLDIGLPDMNGYMAARELRKRGVQCALIALTGYGQESDKAKARDAGFSYHLTKPVGLAQLEEALATVTAT